MRQDRNSNMSDNFSFDAKPSGHGASGMSLGGNPESNIPMFMGNSGVPGISGFP